MHKIDGCIFWWCGIDVCNIKIINWISCGKWIVWTSCAKWIVFIYLFIIIIAGWVSGTLLMRRPWSLGSSVRWDSRAAGVSCFSKINCICVELIFVLFGMAKLYELHVDEWIFEFPWNWCLLQVVLWRANWWMNFLMNCMNSCGLMNIWSPLQNGYLLQAVMWRVN